MTKLAPLGLLATGLLFAGCGEKDGCDTSTGADCDTSETDADADGDSDSDTDSDSDADTDVTFDAYAMGMSVVAGYDGSGLVGYVASGNAVNSFAVITMYEEDYFDAGDDRHLCEDIYDITENGIDDLQVDGIYGGWDISLLYSGPTQDSAPCENFDEDVWGSDTPVDVLEGTALGVGVGPISDTFKNDYLKPWVEGAGYSWETDFAPFWMSYYLAFYDTDSGALAGSELGYTWIFEADENMELVSGTNCLNGSIQCVDISNATELPYPVVLNSGTYFLPYTSNLF